MHPPAQPTALVPDAIELLTALRSLLSMPMVEKRVHSQAAGQEDSLDDLTHVTKLIEYRGSVDPDRGEMVKRK